MATRFSPPPGRTRAITTTTSTSGSPPTVTITKLDTVSHEFAGTFSLGATPGSAYSGEFATGICTARGLRITTDFFIRDFEPLDRFR